MTTIDFTAVTNALLALAAAAISTFGSWALWKLAAKFGVQVSAAQGAQFDAALDKSITYGAQVARDTIAAKGWTHVQTHSAILAAALNHMSNFPDALAGVGVRYETAQPQIEAALVRKLPESLPAVVPPVVPPFAVLPAKGVL